MANAPAFELGQRDRAEYGMDQLARTRLLQHFQELLIPLLVVVTPKYSRQIRADGPAPQVFGILSVDVGILVPLDVALRFILNARAIELYAFE